MSLDFMGFPSSMNLDDDERRAHEKRLRRARTAIDENSQVYGCMRCDTDWIPDNEHNVSRYLMNGFCPKCDRIIVRQKIRGF